MPDEVDEAEEDTEEEEVVVVEEEEEEIDDDDDDDDEDEVLLALPLLELLTDERGLLLLSWMYRGRSGVAAAIALTTSS